MSIYSPITEFSNAFYMMWCYLKRTNWTKIRITKTKNTWLLYAFIYPL